MDEEWLEKFYDDQGKHLKLKVGNKMVSLPGFNKNTTNYFRAFLLVQAKILKSIH
jgi:hypothetical protein